jgi:predicted dehydrogenase
VAAPLDPDRPLRWGILGAGGIASTVGAAISASPGSQILAVAARDAERAASFAAARDIPRSYGSYAQLLADPDIDVVYIATTHAQHHEQALQTFAAGKPALIEKAFTITAWQAAEVVDAARSRGLFCMEAMWMRLNPLVRQARDIAASGRIGEVVGVRADLSKVFPYDPGHRLFDLDAGAGALLDLGVYPVNFAWMILGRPARVEASGMLAPTGSDLMAALQWSYRGGQVAQIYCDAHVESPYTGLITGTGGWIRIETRLHHPSAITVWTADGGTEVITSPGAFFDGYGPQITEVEQCLRAGRTESESVPLADTVAIMELLDDARAQLGVHYAADDHAGG